MVGVPALELRRLGDDGADVRVASVKSAEQRPGARQVRPATTLHPANSTTRRRGSRFRAQGMSASGIATAPMTTGMRTSSVSPATSGMLKRASTMPVPTAVAADRSPCGESSPTTTIGPEEQDEEDRHAPAVGVERPHYRRIHHAAAISAAAPAWHRHVALRGESAMHTGIEAGPVVARALRGVGGGRMGRCRVKVSGEGRNVPKASTGAGATRASLLFMSRLLVVHRRNPPAASRAPWGSRLLAKLTTNAIICCCCTII